MGAYGRKLLARKILASGVSYLTTEEIDEVVRALIESGRTDLADWITDQSIHAVDKGDAEVILRALEP